MNFPICTNKKEHSSTSVVKTEFLMEKGCVFHISSGIYSGTAGGLLFLL
jgi:hypothetical protein